MEITNINIVKVEKEISKLRGFADVVVNNAIAIHGIRIIEGTDGNFFLSFPAKKIKDGTTYTDICHPINQEVRELFTKAIIDKYKELNSVNQN